MKSPRTWRTREEPFEEADWAWVVARLGSPEGSKLEGKSLFRAMRTRSGAVGTYTPGQLRSFQRKVRRWRASEGGEKEVFFSQRHVPGEALQTDWTHGGDLQVTLSGEAFSHLLCHTTLPFSNWRSARVCRSESLASLKDGVQSSLRKLRRRPVFHQTDQSSAATHTKGAGREFNQAYADFVGHHGMKPRSIGVKKPNQNGDAEAGNGALVRAIEQALLLRASRDFVDQAAYQAFVDDVTDVREDLRHVSWITPDHFEHELLAYLGNAFGPEPTLTQSAWFRPHNRSQDIDRLYLVGAGAQPGAGTPSVMMSAKMTARLVAEDLQLG